MYNGILQLPNNDLNNLVQWNRNNKAYETSLSIDLSDISTNPGLLQLEPNQNKVLTQETEQFEIYDYEKDDDLDIREKPTNSPLNTKSTRLITLKNGTRDIIEDDPTYRNIGSFSVTAPLLSSIAISKSQSQFNISDYNQNNNTNYLGVKSIVLTTPEYTACDLFIPTQTTNENMDQNNHLITSNPSWDVYTQNGTSNLWQLFDPTNTDYVSTFWHDNQYLNVHFTGTGTPLIPNKLIYKYNKIGPNDDNNRWHRYHIVLIASDNNVDWNTLLDIDFDEDPTIGDREYYNENANQIEIPINNYHGYTYYQFKTMAWDNWDNQFNYWNLLNCHSEQETPTTINNYNEYTASSPFKINSTGTGTISIPNGYTGLGNINYNVRINPKKLIKSILLRNADSQNTYNITQNKVYWTYYPSQRDIQITEGKEVIIIYKNVDIYGINFFKNPSYQLLRIYGNSWVYINELSSNDNNRAFLRFILENGDPLFSIGNSNDNIPAYISLNVNLFGFDINWMTFR